MLNPLAAVGEVLALTVLVMGFGGFLQFYARTRYRPHLAMLPSVVLVVGSSLLLFSGYRRGDSGQVASFLLIQSIALPFFVYWGERNRRRMEEIATTGDFDSGFPLPSENHVRISFFGQIYEDLAKPIVALEGEEKLNQLLHQFSVEHPILTHAHFTARGEFKLDKETVLKMGRTSLNLEGFTHLLEALIEHFARTGNLDGEELSNALRAKSETTLSKYLDFLIDEGLLHTLAGGLLTDRTSTGTKSLDKALGGGLAEGVAVLLLSDANQEKEIITQTFLRTGMAQGEGCIVVSATRSPEQIRSALGLGDTETPGELRIVDCYTARLSEVPALEMRGDTILSPVALSVVDVAISRALDSLTSNKKRALVDILSPYLMASSVDKIYTHILEIVDRFRRSNCTALFVFNPSVVEEKASGFVLEEFFDCVIKTRIARRGESPSEQLILDFEKLGSRLGPGAEPAIRGGIPVEL